MDENTQPAESILYEDIHPDMELLALAGQWLHQHKEVETEVNPRENSPKMRRWQATDVQLRAMQPKTMAGVLMLAIIAKTYAQVPGKREYAHASAPMAWTIVNSLLRLAA